VNAEEVQTSQTRAGDSFGSAARSVGLDVQLEASKDGGSQRSAG
jgi:hypothetical protein